MMPAYLFSVHSLISFLVLSGLELALGLDNIIFISLIISRFPPASRANVRFTALSIALVMRLLLLWGIVLLSRITATLFTIEGFAVSARDLLFFAGGIFLFWNTTIELKKHLASGGGPQEPKSSGALNGRKAIAQVVLVDMLFSFDSIFTAVGLTRHLAIMAAAVVCGMICMFWLSGKISQYLGGYPALKTLALAFIILVGINLITDSFHLAFPQSWLYVAFGFALAVQMLNRQLQKGE